MWKPLQESGDSNDMGFVTNFMCIHTIALCAGGLFWQQQSHYYLQHKESAYTDCSLDKKE